jgi:hypothetical protein
MVLVPIRLLKQHPEQESTAISNCLELVSKASKKVSVRIDILNDKIAVDTLSETKAIQRNLAKTQTGVQEIHQTLSDIQTNYTTNSKSYITKTKEHSTKLDTLKEYIDKKIQNVTIGLKGELQALQSLLLIAIEQSSQSRSSLRNFQGNLA